MTLSRWLTLLLLAAAAHPAVAAPRWTRATPFGCALATVAVAPSASRIVYAMSPSHALYASRDGGETWGLRGYSTVDSNYEIELIVSPQDPETLYAVVDTIGLMKSRDGGGTWEFIGPWNNDFVRLAVDGGEPDLLYAATASGLYRSRDGGGTWNLAAFKDQFVEP